MLSIARRCVPFTPFDKDLSTATVKLVTPTGVYPADQEPFPTVDPGDISYRVIDGSTDTSALRIAHHHYDHSEADADPNIVFPLDTLRELVQEGFDGSEVGRILGHAGDRPFQKKVVRAALEMFRHDAPPGKVVIKVIR
jgi:D-proline reductase (dithiol) PrdB